MSYLIEALTLGVLYGLGPCTLFCAPILIPLIISTSKNGKEGIVQTFTFGFGRISSYALLGFTSGFFGYLFSNLISKEVIGIFLILLGIFILLRKDPRLCLLRKITGKHLSFVSGMVIGLGPCYPLLALLSLAALTKSYITGALMGFVFGLGSLITPLLFLGFLAGKWAGKEEFRKINTKVCGLFLLILGLFKVL